MLLPGESHGWRSLAGCSPRGAELDTTEWLHVHFSLSCTGEGNGNPLQCSCLENSRDGGTWGLSIKSMGSHRARHNWSDLAAAAAIPIGSIFLMSYTICLFFRIPLFLFLLNYTRHFSHVTYHNQLSLLAEPSQPMPSTRKAALGCFLYWTVTVNNREHNFPRGSLSSSISTGKP